MWQVADTLAAAAESVPAGAGAGAEAEAGAAAALRSLHDGVRLTRAQLAQVLPPPHSLMTICFLLILYCSIFLDSVLLGFN